MGRSGDRPRAGAARGAVAGGPAARPPDGELADHERERGITPATRLTRADLEPVEAVVEQYTNTGEREHQALLLIRAAALARVVGRTGRMGALGVASAS